LALTIEEYRFVRTDSRDCSSLFRVSSSEACLNFVVVVAHYNHERLHEAIGNVTPENLYYGRQREILTHREKIKRLTVQRRKKENLRNAARRKEGTTHSIQMKKNKDFQTQPARFRQAI
jgi:hypothetical protein